MGLLKEIYRRCQVYHHKPRHWSLRAGTIDRRLFRDVCINNEYGLPDRFAAQDIVLDIGAHIGSFALVALKRGAKQIHCFEPAQENFQVLRHNLAPYRDHVQLHHCAVWRSDVKFGQLWLDNPTPRNTGAGSVAEQGAGQAVAAVAFDDLLEQVAPNRGRIRLLKLDCEGAEWPILFTSKKLDRIDALCGEYHLGHHVPNFRLPHQSACTPEALEQYLAERGFRVELRPSVKNTQMGLFFAQRGSSRAPTS